MKKMYFLKDRKEAVIDRLTYMSKHRQEYLQDKEHGMITLQFKQGMPVIRFSSGRVTSYWDFRFVYFIFVQTVDMAGAGMVLCVAVTGSITVLCAGILCYF